MRKERHGDMETMNIRELIKKIIPPLLLVLYPLVVNGIFEFNYGVLLACFVFIYVIAVSGLDLLFGYSGQISMGQAAFFAIGAYGSVMLNMYLGIPILVTMLLSCILATLIAAIIAYPASKLVFHFLSLATIALGEIVYQLIAQSPGNITGNFLGLFTDYISISGYKLNTYTKNYYFFLFCTIIFIMAKSNLVNSRVGRAFIAIRENTQAADGMGINVRKYKVIAFAVSAFYTAFAGSMYAHLVRYISPDTFTMKQSVTFLLMLLFGGTASIGGPIVGVISIQLLNELLRFAERYQMIIYGILLLIVIVGIPGGLYGEINNILTKLKKGKKNVNC